MGFVLPGNHYCKDHQGNHSHYDKHNCDLCKATPQLEIPPFVRTWVECVTASRHARAFDKDIAEWIYSLIKH